MSEGEQQYTELEKRQLYLMHLRAQKLRERKLYSYEPYPKQQAFHAAGRTYREVLFRAGSQLGKTSAAAAEVAYHLTGLYPEWWPGRRFTRANKGWVVSEDMKFSRDNAQRLLLGEPGEWGTGYIPKDCILKINRARHSVDDAVDTILVKHVTGRISKVMFKSCEVPRNKLGGDTLSWAWVDEEPPYDHYLEIVTRTNVTQGPTFITFTPLKGYTPLVKRFMTDKVRGTTEVVMTIYDALHYTQEEREGIIASYPAHQRKARTLGTPTLGAGLIFTTDEELITVKPFTIPEHWPRIVGMDFGITHPFALAFYAIDRDTDTCYLYREYREAGKTPAQHFVPYREAGGWMPVAWPADALQTEKGTGIQLAAQYRKAGFRMLREKAMLPRTGARDENKQSLLSVEAGVFAMSEAMDAGKFKVFNTCGTFFEEYRVYHRGENGMIVKEGEDLIAACRYGFAMRRFASTRPTKQHTALEPFSYSDRT